MELVVGHCIKVCWPTEDGEKFIKTEVIKIKMCDDVKHGTNRKYHLRVFDTDEVIRTRLHHLEWKPMKKRANSSSSSKLQEALIIPPEQPIKRVRNQHSVGRIPLSALQYIVAPMVGASELPFRLLCRKYGATLAYTPMMLSDKFAVDPDYRTEEFQTCAADRPIVAHFAANDPQVFLRAAKAVENQCDAIDLNLGCPQRVAHSGHFGSFLLDDVDRPLVLSMIHTLSRNLTVPVFVKIRLLSTLEETVAFCQQLVGAGAALIAIHARHRVNLVGRTGAGARDGPAFLDQVKRIREVINTIPIITNGNTSTWQHVCDNLALTNAAGLMSAEGILNDPALFNRGQSVNKLQLATEYLDLVARYPTKLKSVLFHIRRMCRQQLEQYQFLQELFEAIDVSIVRDIVNKMIHYEQSGTFRANPDKVKKEKEAEARRQHEEGRRKEFEARMKRKAKREGLPLDHYLSIGAATPTTEEIKELRLMEKTAAFARWKEHHSQHCWAFHFEPAGCPRDRKCAFIHADSPMVEPEAFG